jgi:hypothetical protein
MLFAVVGSSSISNTRILIPPVQALGKRKSPLTALKRPLTIRGLKGKG